MAFFNKTFFYKVYSITGTYITTWKKEVLDAPQFRTIINGGAGQLVFRLGRQIDDFGEGYDVAFNNRLKLYIQDVDSPNGELIFDGFISNYEIYVDGSTEYVIVCALSYAATLPEILIRGGTADNSATTVAYLNEDPGDIFADIVSKYSANGGVITPGTIDLTGDLLDYTFVINNTFDGFERCRALAPAWWYWRVNPDSTVDFKAKSIAADHRLFLGKHIQELKAVKRMEDIKNVIYFIGGDMGGGSILYYIYKRAGSISNFGRREFVMQDGRVTNPDTAEILANNYLDQFDSFEVRTTIKVMDNNGANQKKGYNIESLKVGDTVQVLNSDQSYATLWDLALYDVDFWDYNPAYALRVPNQIQTILYEFDSVTIELSTRIPQISRRVEDIDRNLKQTISDTAPTNPTP